MSSSSNYYIGVDVGTSSVRAALVDGTGRIAEINVQTITIWSPTDDLYQQSSEDIWQACCRAVKVSLPN